MTYYHCPECDGLMDEFEATCLVPEIHTELDGSPTEMLSMLRCIYCGYDELEEARFCEGCGELFPESALDENDLCEECREHG